MINFVFLQNFGWVEQGLDQLRSGLLQQQKSYMQGSQPLHQLQMLTPQHQHQLLLAQQNMTSQSANDESRRLRMLYNNRSMSMGKDGFSNPVGDVPNLGSSMPVIPRGDPEMLLKVPAFFFISTLLFLTFQGRGPISYM